MPVSNSDTMETYISGPRKADGNNIVEIKAKMRILISKEAKTAKVIVDDREYNITVGNWSEWIRARFEIGTMQYVHCIFRAYLASVEPEFNMYVTAMQINPENPLFQISNPEDYSQELAKDIGLFNTLGMPEDTDALVEGRMTEEVFLQQCAQIEEERDRMFWREFEKFNRSDNMLFVFVYDTSDRIQHIFWDEKLLTGTGSVKLNQNIIDYYTNKDRMLGKILDSIDNETGLIILSDHGFSSFERALTMNTWLVKNGYMTLTTEIDESDEAGLFKNVDWSKTKAYSAGFTSIYLNIQGREKQGIVNEKEKEQRWTRSCRS